MWGIFPFGSSILAIFVLLIPGRRRQEAVSGEYPVDENLVPGRMVS
jgi:hypothetical protein